MLVSFHEEKKSTRTSGGAELEGRVTTPALPRRLHKQTNASLHTSTKRDDVVRRETPNPTLPFPPKGVRVLQTQLVFYTFTRQKIKTHVSSSLVRT